mmetsp:Transcript_9612/g.28943  ORF Transcript_9612/g.28943 Transcript_9612/m.28943 type:complete len:198 (-) Transcript_9612:175-768(-)
MAAQLHDLTSDMMEREGGAIDHNGDYVTPEQVAEERLLAEHSATGQDHGGPRGVASQPNGPLVDNSADRSEFKNRLWMFSPYDQMIMHYDDPERMKGYSGIFSRDYRLVHGFATRRESNIKKYLESYKQEPIGIAKPADWFDFDEYERIQLPTCQTPCEKCNNAETEFKTRQLRSADEGQTVFFFCRKCGHKWRTNT